MKTWDLLQPCRNKTCWHKWFIVHGPTVTHCPHCNTAITAPAPVLILRKKTRNGWVDDGHLVVFDEKELFGWHAYDNRFPGESADRTRLAYFKFEAGKWFLVNEKLTSLTSPTNQPVAPRQNLGIELKPGIAFRLANETNGRMAEVMYYAI